MRDRIKQFTNVKERVNETFIWCGAVYKIVHITSNFWIVENLMNGRELKVR